MTATDPAAPVTGVPEPAIVIDLGHGRWTIGTHAGHEALYFEPAPVPGPFGERAPHFTPLDEVLPGSVCIRFDKPEALTFLRGWLVRIADPEGTPDDPAAWWAAADGLPRSAGQDAEGGWTLPISLIQEVHREAVRKSGYSGATLEEVEHVMLETERRLAAMVSPAPDDIVALVKAALDDSFACGAHTSEDNESHATVFDRAVASHEALLAALLDVVRQSASPAPAHVPESEGYPVPVRSDSQDVSIDNGLMDIPTEPSPDALREAALQAAYEAYQDTPLDIACGDEDENREKCIRSAIGAYQAALAAAQPRPEVAEETLRKPPEPVEPTRTAGGGELRPRYKSNDFRLHRADGVCLALITTLFGIDPREVEVVLSGPVAAAVRREAMEQAAEALADAVLKASGSGLRHYTAPSTREAIIEAARQGLAAVTTRPAEATGDAERVTELERERDEWKSEAEDLFDMRYQRDAAEARAQAAEAEVGRRWGEREAALRNVAQRDRMSDTSTRYWVRGAKAAMGGVIKSGEPWIETCQREYDAARGQGRVVVEYDTTARPAPAETEERDDE